MPKSITILKAIEEAKRRIEVRKDKALRTLHNEANTKRAYQYIRSLNPLAEVPEPNIALVSVGIQTDIIYLRRN